MKNKHRILNGNKKGAMSLVELLFAVGLCAVLIGVCVNVFNSGNITRSAYIYSVLTQFKDAHDLVIEDCYKDGECNSLTLLPENINHYCSRLASSLTVKGNFKCTNSESDTTYDFKDSAQREFVSNFQLANGVAFYNINKNAGWNPLGTDQRRYIDAFIDINGKDKGENTIGKDIFAIRIFQDGEIIPSFVAPIGNEDFIQAYNDSEFFGYNIVLNELKDDNKNARTRRVVNANGLLTGETELQSEKPRMVASFRESICRINPSMLSTYYTSTERENYINCTDFNKTLSDCNLAVTDSSYCTVEPAKPKAAGIFHFMDL